MAATSRIGRLLVELGLDSAQYEKQLKSAERQMTQFGRQLQSVGRVATAAITLPLVGLGAAALKVASDTEEMRSKFRVVFGETARDAERWAATQSKAINRSRVELEGFLSTFQDTFVPLGFARDQAAGLSKTLTTLAVDLASFNNAAEPETVQLLTSALVGNHEAVRRFGILITQARLEQELFRLGIEGGVKSASEQQKVLARLNLILSDSSDAHGDAARTVDSFQNQMRGLTGSLRDAAVEVGNTLIPIAKEVVGTATTWVRSFAEMDAATIKMGVAVAAFAAAVPVAITAAGLLAVAIGAIGIPVAAVIAGLAALGAAFVALRATSQKLDTASASLAEVEARIDSLRKKRRQIEEDGLPEIGNIQFTEIDEELEKLDHVAAELRRIEDEAQLAMIGIGEGAATATGQTDALSNAAAELRNLFDSLEGKTSGTASALKQAAKDGAAFWAVLRRLSEESERAAKAQAEAARSIGDLFQGVADDIARLQTDDLTVQLEQAKRKVIELGVAAGLTAEQVAAQLGVLEHLYAKLGEETEKAAQEAAAAAGSDDTVNAIVAPFERASQGIQRTLVDALDQAFSGSIDSAADFADELLALMRRTAAEIAAALIFSPQIASGGTGGTQTGGGILGSLFGGIGSLFGGGGGGTGGVEFTTALDENTEAIYTNTEAWDQVSRALSNAGGAGGGGGGIAGLFGGGALGAGVSGILTTLAIAAPLIADGVGKLGNGLGTGQSPAVPLGAGTGAALGGIGATAGVVAGVAAGAIAGGSIGTYIFPVVGTIIGAALGAAVGVLVDVLATSPRKSRVALATSADPNDPGFATVGGQVVSAQSPFGFIGFERKQKIGNERSFIDAVADFDFAISAFLDQRQIEIVSDYIQGLDTRLISARTFGAKDFGRLLGIRARDAIESLLLSEELTAGGDVVGIARDFVSPTGLKPEGVIKGFEDFTKAFTGLVEGLRFLRGEEMSEGEQALRQLEETLSSLRPVASALGVSLDVLNDAFDEGLAKIQGNALKNEQRAIDAIERPLVAALDALEEGYQERVRTFEALGLETILVTRRYELERAEIIEQYAQRVNGAVRNLLQQITASTASPLAFETVLQNAGTAFVDAVAARQAGDFDADVAGTASALIDVLREGFASGVSFFEGVGDIPGFDRIVEILQELDAQFPATAAAAASGQLADVIPIGTAPGAADALAGTTPGATPSPTTTQDTATGAGLREVAQAIRDADEAQQVRHEETIGRLEALEGAQERTTRELERVRFRRTVAG